MEAAVAKDRHHDVPSYLICFSVRNGRFTLFDHIEYCQFEIQLFMIPSSVAMHVAG